MYFNDNLISPPIRMISITDTFELAKLVQDVSDEMIRTQKRTA